MARTRFPGRRRVARGRQEVERNIKRSLEGSQGNGVARLIHPPLRAADAYDAADGRSRDSAQIPPRDAKFLSLLKVGLLAVFGNRLVEPPRSSFHRLEARSNGARLAAIASLDRRE